MSEKKGTIKRPSKSKADTHTSTYTSTSTSTNTTNVAQTSPKARRKKNITNTYEIEQFKKLIGKNAIQLHRGFIAKVDLRMKEKILSGGVATIAMSGYVKNGVVYIYEGMDRYIAINSISYAELKKYLKKEIYIVVNQTNPPN